MAIPDGVAKYVFSGTLVGGAEKFATSFWVTGWTAGTFPDDASALAALTSAPWTGVKAMFQSLLAPSSSLTDLDIYFYMGGVAVKHAHAPWAVPGTGTGCVPPQVSSVLTLRTGLSTRHGRGRMYFPATNAANLDANGGMASSPQATVLNAMQTLFQLLSTSPLHVVVLSQTTTATNPVTTIDSDRILDTQRRRRNKLTGSRTSRTI